MSAFSITSSDPELDPVPVICDTSYSSTNEIIKFSVQYCYILFGIFLNLVILYTLLWKFKKVYMTHSYFVLFAVDCILNISILITEGVLARFLIYFTPACQILAEYFSTPLIGFKLVMISTHHTSICKSLMQALLVMNRMTCVVFPLSHEHIWRPNMRFVIPSVLLLPIVTDWNIAISRVYMQSTYGGFWVSYFKKVSWASQSRFQTVFVVIAIFSTVVCTTITLIKLPKKLKELERSITYATIFISIAFTIKAAFQIYYSFFFTYSDASSPVYGISFLALDFMTIGSPSVMLCFNKPLRKHALSGKPRENKHLAKMLSKTSGILIAR